VTGLTRSKAGVREKCRNGRVVLVMLYVELSIVILMTLGFPMPKGCFSLIKIKCKA